ncbi:MAG: radical SAM protein, partial [Chloroflexi bacterium]|nr:radical SAM protein [Chloroflexota bacterium]
RAGRILTLTNGAVSSLAPSPIEKKPFYHFHPGSYALTVGSWSCNFGCPWCQNWEISKVLPSAPAEFLAPDDFVRLTERYGCKGTSVSFNEPTLSLEWSLEGFRLARKHGLYNTYVTNGYMTPEALALLAEAGLDAMNVDIKGDAQAVRRYCKGIEVEHVWSTCKAARSMSQEFPEQARTRFSTRPSQKPHPSDNGPGSDVQYTLLMVLTVHQGINPHVFHCHGVPPIPVPGVVRAQVWARGSAFSTKKHRR